MNWIKCSERLPELVDEEYIVYGMEAVSTLNWTEDGWYSDVFQTTIDRDVITHWMPLPEPPAP